MLVGGGCHGVKTVGQGMASWAPSRNLPGSSSNNHPTPPCEDFTQLLEAPYFQVTGHNNNSFGEQLSRGPLRAQAKS